LHWQLMPTGANAPTWIEFASIEMHPRRKFGCLVRQSFRWSRMMGFIVSLNMQRAVSQYGP